MSEEREYASAPIVSDEEMLRAYAEIVRLKDAEIERLKALLTRAVNAMEAIYNDWPVLGPADPVIAELRKATE